VSLDTEPMEGMASPRNPRVMTESRSLSSRIFEVACRRRLSLSSSGVIPDPLSRMRMRSLPAPASSISMRVAPASSEFSTSSLTAAAGRSSTSPAAIWLMVLVSRSWMRGVGVDIAIDLG